MQQSDGPAPPGEVGGAESYVERLPLASLAGWVRTVWVQQTGQGRYEQRNLPTGGVELQCPLGGSPRVIGPLTEATVQALPPYSTVVGARFWPGAAPQFLGVPADELLDLSVGLDDVWRGNAVHLGEALATAPDPLSALGVLQHFLSSRQADAAPQDTLVAAAVRRLMPGQLADVGALSAELRISASQLRRRFLTTVGVGPKVLQRTLRFQGYLARAQAAARPGRRVGTVADTAAAAGYSDHAHLTRECRRLTGLTPTELFGGRSDRCRYGHDHAASYRFFTADARGSDPRSKDA